MRPINRALAFAIATLTMAAAAGTASAAWRFEQNGPHPTMKLRPAPKSSSVSAVRVYSQYSSVERKCRPTTIKPFIRRC
jgi:hypothetical protein